MTMFNYAQSNSLLKGEVNEKLNDEKSPDKMSSNDVISPQRSGALAPSTSGVLVIPMIDTGTSDSSGITKEKTKPFKKSQHNKHKFANDTIATIEVPNKSGSLTSNQLNKPSNSSTKSTQDSSDPIASDSNDDAENKPKKMRIRKPRRAIPSEKRYISENEQPAQSDIVGGRGGRSNHHPGNRPYWIRILESRLEYTRSRSDHEKARIANGILKYVHEHLKGRFLNIDSKTKRWYILPDTVVLDKIKQALRDKYIPYWARDLKIENKKHDSEHSAPVTKNTATNKFNSMTGMNNNSPHPPLNAMPPFGSSFGALQNPLLVNQAVTLAAIKASRANAANALGFGGHAAARAVSPPRAPTNNSEVGNKSENKLSFLFGGSQRRQLGPTAAIPTVDDILKCKVDQMPSFGGVPNTGLMAAAMASVSATPLSSFGMNPFQTSLPPTAMNSLGLGGLPGPNALLNDAAHRGFGAGGNPGAPALPHSGYGVGANFNHSIGVLQGLNVKSLDKYLEDKMAVPSLGAAALGPNGANLSSLGMMNALAGNNRASHSPTQGTSSAFTPAAKAPSGAKKTDWNAMYARALTNSK